MRGDTITTGGSLERVVDRWHGQGAETAAWDACMRAAAALKGADLTDRYGVSVRKRWTVIDARRVWEYQLVLVDRDPAAGEPPPGVAHLLSGAERHDRAPAPLLAEDEASRLLAVARTPAQRAVTMLHLAQRALADSLTAAREASGDELRQWESTLITPELLRLQRMLGAYFETLDEGVR